MDRQVIDLTKDVQYLLTFCHECLVFAGLFCSV